MLIVTVSEGFYSIRGSVQSPDPDPRRLRQRPMERRHVMGICVPLNAT